MSTQPARSPDPAPARQPAPKPPCAVHPRRPSKWFCATCQAPRCDACVNVYRSREGDNASCRKCGERCDPILDKAAPEGRPGAAETEQERLARWRRDFQVPAIVAAAAAVTFLIYTAIAQGPIIAVLTLVPWAIVSSAAAGLVLYYSPAEFDTHVPLVLKAAALGLTVHIARATAFGLFDVKLPETGGYGGIGEALAMLAPLAISFVLVPMGVILILVNEFFELELNEKVFLVILLFLADAISFGMLKMGRLPA